MVEKRHEHRFQSLQGLILTIFAALSFAALEGISIPPRSDFNIYTNKDNMVLLLFQSLQGLILTKMACNGLMCDERFQSLQGLILTM